MRVLIIEDSERLRRSLSEGLRRSGFVVDAAGDGQAGLDQCAREQYTVIVLDLMLPKLDGLSLLKCLRKRGDHTHVLILSAKDQLADRVAGLNLGADDYLVKPFAFDELLARINALQRRRFEAKSPHFLIKSLDVDINARTARLAGEAISLSRLEFDLLALLLMRRGRVVTRAQIFDQLYDSASDPMSNVVDVLVYALRKKIQRAGDGDIILTRRGLGYLIEQE